jgi:uncharacterized protein HemY
MNTLARMIFIICLSAVLAWIVTTIHGYVLIQTSTLTIETTLWTALLCTLFFLWFTRLLLRSWHLLRYAPSTWHHWRNKRSHSQAIIILLQALKSAANQDWKSVENNLSQIANKLNNNHAWLAAAYINCTHNNGNRTSYLIKQAKKNKASELSLNLIQANVLFHNNQYEQAYTLYQKLQHQLYKQPFVLTQLMHICYQKQQWDKLYSWIHLYHEHIGRLKPSIQHYQQAAYQGCMEEMTDEQVTTLWPTLEKSYRYHIGCLKPYLIALLNQVKPNPAKALKTASKAMQSLPQSEIISSLMTLPFDRKKCIPLLIKWLSHYPQYEAECYQALGDLYYRESLFNQALEAYQKANELSKTATLYIKIAYIHTLTDQQDKTNQALAQAIDLVIEPS